MRDQFMNVIQVCARFLKKNERWFVALSLLLIFTAIQLLTLNRWHQFEYYYFDHGIFDQSLWKVAHGQWPIFDHNSNPQRNQLGDHFTPSLYLLTPLYWLTSSYQPLIILQNIFFVLTLYVLYKIGKQLKLPAILIGALLFAMTAFAGTQNGLIAGFHTEIPAMLTLSIALFHFEKKQYRWMVFFLLITLGFKETFVTLIAAFALVLLLQKKQRPLGLMLLAFSVGYYFLVVRAIIPYFRGGEAYGYHLPPLQPTDFVTKLFLPVMKSHTIFLSLLNVGFLPLFTWQLWPLWIQDFILRFVFSESASSWDLGMHYSLISGFLLTYTALKGSVVVLKQVHLRVPRHVFTTIVTALSVGVFTTSLLLNYKLRSPIGLIFNRDFYTQSQTMRFLADFVEKIPREGLVMTQNNLAVRLTHGANVMLLRAEYWDFLPQVIAIDIRKGQNPNNYWPADLGLLYSRLSIDPNYTRTEITKELLIFEKKSQPDLRYYDRYASQPK